MKAAVQVFTQEGRERLGALLDERMRELGLNQKTATEWIVDRLPDGVVTISRQSLRSVLLVQNEPSWQTLAVLAATIFEGRYTVHDLAAIACGEEPKKAPGAPTTGNDSPA